MKKQATKRGNNRSGVATHYRNQRKKKAKRNPTKKRNNWNGGSKPNQTSLKRWKPNRRWTGGSEPFQDFLKGFESVFSTGSTILGSILPFLGSGGTHVSHNRGPMVTMINSGNDGAVPVSKGFNIRADSSPVIESQGKGHYRFVHGGIIADVNIVNTLIEGDLILTYDINPFLEEWLGRMSQFEKYRLKNCVIAYEPTLPATQAGGVIGFFQWDVDSTWMSGQGPEAVRTAMAHMGAAGGNVWERNQWVFTNEDEAAEWWYVDTGGHEPRLTTQGRFHLLASTDFTGESGTLAAGYLRVGYDVEFAVPEIGSNPLGTWTAAVGAINGTAPCPYGDPLEDFEFTYTTSDAIIPQNLQLLYKVVDAGTAKGIFQMQVGYYMMICRFVGTGLGTLSFTLYGSYETIAPSLAFALTNAAQTLSIGYLCFYSGGLFALNDTMEPTEGVQPKFTAITGITTSQVTVLALNGVPPYINEYAVAGMDKLRAEFDSKLKILESKQSSTVILDQESQGVTSVKTKIARDEVLSFPCAICHAETPLTDRVVFRPPDDETRFAAFMCVDCCAL